MRRRQPPPSGRCHDRDARSHNCPLRLLLGFSAALWLGVCGLREGMGGVARLRGPWAVHLSWEADAMTWTSALRPTDITDPATGEPLYVMAKIRPHWYWGVRRLWLFARIVWRRWDTDTSRLDWRTAWAVSKVARGISQ